MSINIKSHSSWYIIYLLVFEHVIQFQVIHVLSQKLTQRVHVMPMHSKLRRDDDDQLFGDIDLNSDQDQSENDDIGDISSLLTLDSCFYDCKAWDKYLASKRGIKWLYPKFINAFFRGISQVVIANNPITGLLILLGIFWSNFVVGLITSFATAIAVFTAWCIGQTKDSISLGLTTYNAVLVGSVISSLWPVIYKEPITAKVWGIVMVGSVMSVFINSGVGNILEHWDLPTLTLPFNIVTSLMFTVFNPATSTAARSSSSESTNLIEQSDAEKQIDLTHEFNTEKKIDLNLNKGTIVLRHADLEWWKVIEGIIYSVGQVYAVQTIPGSILMYIGMFIYSPILMTMALVGATVGTLMGLIFTTKAPYTNIYTGIWGYNGILAAIAVGCFFFPLNRYSLLSAVLDVIFAVFIQQALALAFSPLNLPTLTYPFVLSTYMFLAVTTHEDYLTRVTNFSYPEKHLADHIKLLRDKAHNKTVSTTTERIIPPRSWDEYSE